MEKYKTDHKNPKVSCLLKLSTRASWLINFTLSAPTLDTLVTPNPAIFSWPPLSRKIFLAPYQDSNSKVRDNRERQHLNEICSPRKQQERRAGLVASFPHLTLALGRSVWWGPVCTDGGRSCPYTVKAQQETLQLVPMRISTWIVIFSWKFLN